MRALAVLLVSALAAQAFVLRPPPSSASSSLSSPPSPSSPASPLRPLRAWIRTPPATSPAGLLKKEQELLSAIRGLSRREEQNPAEVRAKVRALVDDLEKAKGSKQPARAKEVNGKWRLIYTSSDNTASPIQRGFVGNQAFSVYQLIDLNCPPSVEPTVTNVVDFGRLGELRVQALASTAARPIPGFVPRRGDGRILGLNIFGISKTEVPLGDPDARIDFQFVDAGFDLSVLPFRLPYPVPFRMLGDEVKGWIEVTYLSPRLRISRGNKGTTFVLEKVDDE